MTILPLLSRLLARPSIGAHATDCSRSPTNCQTRENVFTTASPSGGRDSRASNAIMILFPLGRKSVEASGIQLRTTRANSQTRRHSFSSRINPRYQKRRQASLGLVFCTGLRHCDVFYAPHTRSSFRRPLSSAAIPNRVFGSLGKPT